MKSMVTNTGNIGLPLITGEYSMIEFNLETFAGLTNQFKHIAQQMTKGITHNGGKAYFTIHGKKLKKGETLRRGGAHIDGNYEPHLMTFGGGGWKVGRVETYQKNTARNNRPSSRRIARRYECRTG